MEHLNTGMMWFGQILAFKVTAGTLFNILLSYLKYFQSFLNVDLEFLVSKNVFLHIYYTFLGP